MAGPREEGVTRVPWPVVSAALYRLTSRVYCFLCRFPPTLLPPLLTLSDDPCLSLIIFTRFSPEDMPWQVYRAQKEGHSRDGTPRTGRDERGANRIRGTRERGTTWGEGERTFAWKRSCRRPSRVMMYVRACVRAVNVIIQFWPTSRPPPGSSAPRTPLYPSPERLSSRVLTLIASCKGEIRKRARKKK